MISQALLDVVCCPDCRGAMRAESAELVCAVCGRRTSAAGREYLDLRPAETFAESTKYLNDEMHADGRYETVSPPLLTAAIRNDTLRAFLAIGANDRVVDLGCGSGRVLVWNRVAGVHFVGVDVSPSFAAEARREIDLLVADLRQLPLEDGAFTKAYSLDVLEHLSREDLVRMLGEASRILSPGGTFFVYSHVRKNSRIAFGLRAINLLAGFLERLGLMDLSHERLRKSDHRNPLADIDDLHQVVGQAGFRITRLRYYTPLVGGFAENILKKMVEHLMERRAARRRNRSGVSSAGSPSETGARRLARADTQCLIEARGAVYTGLRALTWLMKLDVLLFGRIMSGPFFALLERLPESAAGSMTAPR